MKLHAVLVAAAMLAAAAPAHADDQPIAVQIVDALNKAFGVHPGFRANHAKGIVTEGSFKAFPVAQSLSTAAIFSGTTIPVTVRFSDSTGVPNLPDGAGGANPHGMAIKYHLPDGSDTDMVINSLKFFIVSNGEDFRDLFLAIAASPPDAPKPTNLDQFVAAHPALPAALATIATPDSFADEEYFGQDAFVFVNKAGKRQAVRYQMVPTQVVHLRARSTIIATDHGVEQALTLCFDGQLYRRASALNADAALTPQDAAKKAPDFLITDITDRLKSGPVSFHLKAQLAAAGDQTSDPTKAWPSDRPVTDLGILTINKALPDSDQAQKRLLFVPTELTDGIEASDDPIIGIRGGAYAVSFGRRLR